MRQIRLFLDERAPVLRRWILLVTIAAVPVFFLRTGHDPFNVPKLALLTTGVSLAASLRLAEALQGRSLATFKRLLIPAVAIAGPLLLAWLFSSYKEWALFGKYGRFQGLLPYLLVIVLGLLLVDAFQDRAKQLAWALVVSGSIVAVYGLVQFVGADPFAWGFPYGATSQSLSTLGNSNFAGGFLGIVLPIAVGLAFVDQRHRGRAIRLSLLIFIGLLATKSEGGWTAGLAGTAMVVGIWASPRWRQARMLGAVVAILAIGGLLGISAFSIVRPDNTLVPETLKLRAWWWQEATSMAADAPLVGHGPNAFAVEIYQYRTATEAEATHFGTTDDPHSVLASFLANAGVIGLAGFLTVFGWVTWHALKRWSDDILSAAFLGGIVAYFVQSFVTIDELSLRVALWTVLAGFVLARLPAPKKVKAKGKKTTKTSKTKRLPSEPLKAPVVVALLAVIPIASIVWSAGLLVADYRFLRGEQLFAAGRTDEARREFDLALGFRDEYEMRHSYGFRVGDTGVALEREAYIDEARRVFAYLDGFPDVAALRDYARVMRQWSAIDPSASSEAERLYARAIQLDEQNPRLQEEAANVLKE